MGIGVDLLVSNDWLIVLCFWMMILLVGIKFLVSILMWLDICSVLMGMILSCFFLSWCVLWGVREWSKLMEFVVIWVCCDWSYFLISSKKIKMVNELK